MYGFETKAYMPTSMAKSFKVYGDTKKQFKDFHKEVREMFAKRDADFLWSCLECIITKQSIEHLKTCTKEMVVACLLYLGVTMNNYKASILDNQVVDVFRNGSFVRSYSRNEW